MTCVLEQCICCNNKAYQIGSHASVVNEEGNNLKSSGIAL